ncbi:hypothetical protein RRG08_049670 [Elysia crispata]|uniref:DDE Tnp4 domain-containing protein n=1 Tax=Elysia crispata TaxID=231223 RepID=A0AAE1CTD7_9GAST|nr:hypothetical protein RRG08_049670 [Elysia crispata]
MMFFDPLIINPVILHASHQRKRMWCRPIYSARRTESEYATLYPKLLHDPEKFQNYARMSQPSFHELHDLIKDYIQPGFTNFRDSISTEERLLMTLRYLASGTSFQHIGYNYRVSHNHTGFIVSETCRAIWERLTPLCLPIPDRDTWERIADEYYRLWNFPNCVGSIDGTHQEIQCPKHAGESAFGQDFENNRLDLPPPKPLPNTDQELPFVFLADEAYPLRENLITPYARRSLSNPSRIFNARLSRARKSVECAFGLAKKKIEVLHRPIRCSVERATVIIQASYVLHNFVRQRDGLPLQANTENAVNNNITSLGPIAHSGRHSIRDGFRNYFHD